MADQATKSSTSEKNSSAAKKKTGARSSRKSTRAAAKPEDAIKLLKNDYKEVRGMFEKFDKTDDDSEKEKLARKICHELTVHAHIEEEIFYPAARAAEIDEDLLDEANVEHATAKHLIAQIEQMSVDDDLFDAMVTVLGEYVKHHVEEEENELFPECRESGMDLKALGAELADRKAEYSRSLSSGK